MTKPKVFIFAADEVIGFEIVRNLLDTKKFKDEIGTIYAGIMDESKRDDLKELGAEVVKYEENNLGGTKEYLEKSDIAVLIVHTIDNAFLTAGLMVEKVYESKVPYSILISQSNTDKSPITSPLRKFLLLEGAFKRLGLKGAIVQSGFITDNLLHTSKSVRHENKLKLCLGDGLITPISKKDISFAVATYLTKHFKEDKPLDSSETIVLTGDKEYDGNGIAAAIGKVTNEDVAYEDISRDEMNKLLEDQGLSNQHREYVLDLFAIAKGGNFKFITKDYENITNEKPEGVKKFIKDNDNNFKPKSFCKIF